MKCGQCPHALSRRINDGSGCVREIDISDFEVCLKTWENEEFTFDGSRKRWTHNGAPTNRNVIEDRLKVWPGYLDCLEDLFINRLREEWDRESNAKRLYWDAHKMSERLEQEYARLSRITTKREKPAPTQPPIQLKSIVGVERAHFNQSCYVYFLLDGDEVVYVGKTSQPWPKRILDHIKNGAIDFDDVWRLEVDESSLNDVELKYIKKFKPKYNSVGKDTPGAHLKHHAVLRRAATERTPAAV